MLNSPQPRACLAIVFMRESGQKGHTVSHSAAQLQIVHQEKAMHAQSFSGLEAQQSDAHQAWPDAADKFVILDRTYVCYKYNTVSTKGARWRSAQRLILQQQFSRGEPAINKHRCNNMTATLTRPCGNADWAQSNMQGLLNTCRLCRSFRCRSPFSQRDLWVWALAWWKA